MNAGQIQDEKIRFPKWCPSRYHAVIDREWEGRISSSFDRMATSDLITEMLPDGHINGSAYHDPYRISVSIRSDDLFPVDKDINLRVHVSQKWAYQLLADIYNIII